MARVVGMTTIQDSRHELPSQLGGAEKHLQGLVQRRKKVYGTEKRHDGGRPINEAANRRPVTASQLGTDGEISSAYRVRILYKHRGETSLDPMKREVPTVHLFDAEIDTERGCLPGG